MEPLAGIAGGAPKVVSKPEFSGLQRQGPVRFHEALGRLERYRGVARLEGRQHIPGGV
jgi:hypothetical protein